MELSRKHCMTMNMKHCQCLVHEADDLANRLKHAGKSEAAQLQGIVSRAHQRIVDAGTKAELATAEGDLRAAHETLKAMNSNNSL